MWVIFLLSALAFAVLALVIVLIANKIYLKIEKGNAKAKREIENLKKKEDLTNE